jgi:hypothetical protein
MTCCSSCLGGVCQMDAYCVYGGQTCQDECSQQGASCGGTGCVYDSQCPNYPNESCVQGSCVSNVAATIPLPTPTTVPTSRTEGGCNVESCSNPVNPLYFQCRSCTTTTPTSYTTVNSVSIGLYSVYKGQTAGGWYQWETYTCEVNQYNSTMCTQPHSRLHHTTTSPYPTMPSDITLGLQGCWLSSCGPYPQGQIITPQSAPTPTLSSLNLFYFLRRLPTPTRILRR